MKRYLLTIAAAVVFSTGAVIGQTPELITLDQAIQLALDNNFSLKQAENNLELSEKNIQSEYADFLPNLSASLSGRRSTGNQFNNNTGEFVNNTLLSLSGSVSSSITVFGGFENINSLRQAEQDHISSEESLKRAKESLIFNTARSYLQVILNEELLAIAQSNLETSIRQLEQIQAQVEVGALPIVDQYNQEATVANDELTVTNNENALDLSELALIRQLQIDPLREYEFVIPEIDTEDAAANDYSINNLVNQALANRSDLISERASIKSLEYQEQITKASILPSLSLSGSISSDANDQTTDPLTGDNTPFNDQFFDRNVGNSLSLSLSIPIFNNLDRSLSIQNSKVQLKNAELSYQDSELGVIEEVVQAYTEYVSIVKQLEANDKALLASERAFETEQERYNVGATTLIELSQAQSSYVSAQSNYTQALYNLIFQEKLLDYYLGLLSGENIEF